MIDKWSRKWHIYLRQQDVYEYKQGLDVYELIALHKMLDRILGKDYKISNDWKVRGEIKLTKLEYLGVKYGLPGLRVEQRTKL